MLIFIVKKKGKTGNYGRGKGRGNIHFKRGEKGETGNSVREIDLSRVEALVPSKSETRAGGSTTRSVGTFLMMAG